MVPYLPLTSSSFQDSLLKTYSRLKRSRRTGHPLLHEFAQLYSKFLSTTFPIFESDEVKALLEAESAFDTFQDEFRSRVNTILASKFTKSTKSLYSPEEFDPILSERATLVSAFVAAVEKLSQSLERYDFKTLETQVEGLMAKLSDLPVPPITNDEVVLSGSIKDMLEETKHLLETLSKDFTQCQVRTDAAFDAFWSSVKIAFEKAAATTRPSEIPRTAMTRKNFSTAMSLETKMCNEHKRLIEEKVPLQAARNSLMMQLADILSSFTSLTTLLQRVRERTKSLPREKSVLETPLYKKYLSHLSKMRKLRRRIHFLEGELMEEDEEVDFLDDEEIAKFETEKKAAESELRNLSSSSYPRELCFLGESYFPELFLHRPELDLKSLVASDGLYNPTRKLSHYVVVPSQPSFPVSRNAVTLVEYEGKKLILKRYPMTQKELPRFFREARLLHRAV